ncbi:MAG: LacI family DNA-binding transcriptional regulator [Turicibacter sp.]
MIGIKDVAKHAGVAIGTVSRVINNHSTVNPEIRERVLKSIEELNYIPDEVARSFKLRTTKMVAFLIPSIWNPFFSELAHYVEDELDKNGYKLLLCNSGGKPEKEKYYLEMLKQNKVAGILGITYNQHQNEINSKIPFVSIDRLFSEDVPCVTSDNYNGGQLAAQNLIECGCTNIAFIGKNSSINSEVDKREIGFYDKAIEMGISPIIYDFNDFEDEYTICREFFLKYPNLDGIFVKTDLLAATYIKVLTENGVRVPQDVKVIGYDGIQNNNLFHPILTTIRQPVEEIGREAVTLLLKKINNIEIDDYIVRIPVHLKKGETV